MVEFVPSIGGLILVRHVMNLQGRLSILKLTIVLNRNLSVSLLYMLVLCLAPFLYRIMQLKSVGCMG